MRVEQTSSWPTSNMPGIVWLGQAGFWIETGHHKILIDPYLSDSLSKKYAGKKNDHKRMVKSPIATDDLPRPDVVLITHAHTDHLDPETLGPLAIRFPDLPFVVPASKADIARERIGSAANLILADSDQSLTPIDGLNLSLFPAAHETLERDKAGRHVFLGYGISSGGLKIYHSGDTVPYPGLQERIDIFAPDIALLPVNGRDKERLASGVPGNLNLAEAIDLCRNVSVLIPHHWGMFHFNTIEPSEIDKAASNSGAPTIVKPAVGKCLSVHASLGQR